MTQVTHLIGMILWASGRRVTDVCAFMNNRDLAVDLVDAIAFRLNNGGVGSIGSTGNLRPGDPHQREVRYYGSEGYALQDLMSAAVEIHFVGDVLRGSRPRRARTRTPLRRPPAASPTSLPVERQTWHQERLGRGRWSSLKQPTRPQPAESASRWSLYRRPTLSRSVNGSGDEQ